MMQRDTPTLAKAVGDALERGDRADFVEAVRGLVAAKARLATGWKAIADPLVQFGEFDLARQAMAFHARAQNYAPVALFDQAMVFARTARPDLAAATLARIARTVPDRASNAYLRGTLALNLGDFDAAEAALLDAAAAHPTSGQIWQTLSSIGSMAKRPVVAERILAADRSMADAGDAERGSYGYALGKTLADLGEHDRAFAAYAAGAAIIALQRPYAAAADGVSTTRATQGWTRELIAAAGERITVASDRAIIVTGLPRSGSTLIEQILVSHSEVSDGDELGKFGLVVQEVGGVDAAALARWTVGRQPDEASGLYLHLLSQRFGPVGRVVDKTLGGSRYLGLLASLMPEAPIVWVRRKPLDNAWSCFRAYFLLGLPWSWSQEAIAAHFKLEEVLLARWQEILGDRLLVVDYERLVADKEEVVPTIAAHAGLTMEPQLLLPEKTRRLVTTNSVAQVREPINTGAVDSAEPYRRHLQPFIDAYGTI